MSGTAARLFTGALTALVAVTLVGCSSSATAGSGHPNTSAASTPTLVVSTPPASSSAPVSSAVPVSSAAASTAASSAASVVTGAKPPAGDAAVHFGQPSLVALTNFTTEKTDTIKLTISMKPGSISDLKNFDLDAQSKQGTPFYVSYALTNLSTRKIDSSGFAGRLTVSNASGDEASSLTLLGDFPKCEGDAPDKMAPGASGHGCDVYILPKGQQVAKVSISNGDSGAITWS